LYLVRTRPNTVYSLSRIRRSRCVYDSCCTTKNILFEGGILQRRNQLDVVLCSSYTKEPGNVRLHCFRIIQFSNEKEDNVQSEIYICHWYDIL
jgi:hypothetical protein